MAEMSFISQVAKGLSVIGHQVNLIDGERFRNCIIQLAAGTMVLMVFGSQCFAFAGLITESYYWYMLEELCWGLAFLVGLPFFCGLSYEIWQIRTDRCLDCTCSCGAFVYAAGLSMFSLVYVTYILFPDMPLYFKRYQWQLSEGFEPFGFWDGLWDAAATRRRTHALDVWEFPKVWQTVYFSVGVWMSLLLALAPRLEVTALDPATATLSGVGRQSADGDSFGNEVPEGSELQTEMKTLLIIPEVVVSCELSPQ